ncbi:hypothetical protein [Sphaerothrix gracilis]|uniref:hypothetical protein n=1 Tax=Sphaerothrix gracilis TaxID=3151835 RepID=UPI0031FBE7D4
MLKATHIGLAACLTLLPVEMTSVSLDTTDIAQALPPLITEICPDVTWADGFRIGELVPLAPHQYHAAVTITTTPLRAGYGFESEIITDLTVGTKVMVRGEVWDMGCNQWMVVSEDPQMFVHGNALLNL